MAKDIFQTEIQFGGAFKADSAKLKFPAIAGDAADLTGFLVQNLQLQYSQQITKLYEVGGNNIYYVGGRTQGQVTFARIIGPKRLAANFYTSYGNLCNVNKNNIDLELQSALCATTETGSAVTYKAQFCLITTVGFSVGAQDMLINESVTMMFGLLEIK